ncbi:MAG: hypothetical protein GC137_06635 [Alphaproteobacteria bacterium]|nr:hypothetical protein [Alphaproteobacteria bacterium]
MSSNLSEQVDYIFRLSVPYITMFFLVSVNLSYLHLPLSFSVTLPIALMVIYYWSIYRPTLIPPAFVFILGVLMDLVGNLPVGLTAFLFLFVRHIISDQRLFLTGQPFFMIWLGFFVVSSVLFAAEWFLFGLTSLQWTPLQPVAANIILGALVFPMIMIVLNLSHKALPPPLDPYKSVQ